MKKLLLFYLMQNQLESAAKMNKLTFARFRLGDFGCGRLNRRHVKIGNPSCVGKRRIRGLQDHFGSKCDAEDE